MSASFVDRAKDRYQAYREYAEAVIESKHTYIELQLAEMVLDLLEAVEDLMPSYSSPNRKARSHDVDGGDGNGA